MLLDENELSNLNQTIKTVKEEKYLSQGVYPMKVLRWESGTDKNSKKYLRVVVDSGFLNEKKEPRTLNTIFYTEGEDTKGNKKIEELARFLKRCFKAKEVSNKTLEMTVNRNISVATFKDEKGFLQFWYAGHIDELQQLKNGYKKRENKGAAPDQQPATEQLTGTSVPATEEDEMPF